MLSQSGCHICSFHWPLLLLQLLCGHHHLQVVGSRLSREVLQAVVIRLQFVWWNSTNADQKSTRTNNLQRIYFRSVTHYSFKRAHRWRLGSLWLLRSGGERKHTLGAPYQRARWKTYGSAPRTPQTTSLPLSSWMWRRSAPLVSPVLRSDRGAAPPPVREWSGQVTTH